MIISIEYCHSDKMCIDHHIILKFISTVCALIFAGFNVRGFRGSAAIREYFVREYLDITVNGLHSSSQSMTSCVTKMAIIGYGANSLR